MGDFRKNRRMGLSSQNVSLPFKSGELEHTLVIWCTLLHYRLRHMASTG